jgi:hypothetical protein
VEPGRRVVEIADCAGRSAGGAFVLPARYWITRLARRIASGGIVSPRIRVWRDGTSYLLFESIEFLDKLAACSCITGQAGVGREGHIPDAGVVLMRLMGLVEARLLRWR